MAKNGKCLACKKILGWPMDVRLEQMVCTCGEPLVQVDFGDVRSIPYEFFNSIKAVPGKLIGGMIQIYFPTSQDTSLHRRKKRR